MSEEMRAILESERKEGIQQGMKQGMLNAFAEMVKDKLLSVAEAAKRLGVSESEFAKLAKI